MPDQNQLTCRVVAAAGRSRRVRALRAAAVLLTAALAGCASVPSGDAVPVAERELPASAVDAIVAPPADGQVGLADGVFRVHLSNIRCFGAPCPNGYMVSNVEGYPPALRAEAVQPVSLMPERIRFDASSGGPVEEGLVERTHVGDGVVVQGRAWLVDDGRTLRVEIERLPD